MLVHGVHLHPRDVRMCVLALAFGTGSGDQASMAASSSVSSLAKHDCSQDEARMQDRDNETAGAAFGHEAASAALGPALGSHTIQADIVFLGKRICGDVFCTYNWAPQAAAESIQAMEKPTANT
eukprot:2809779-Amphidinium_carterae.2